MQKTDTIYVAGGTGMVGSAIIRKLKDQGFSRILSTYHSRRSQDKGVAWHQLDLTDQQAVQAFFKTHRPNVVFLAAAKVGGIGANTRYRADFLSTNLQIQTNIITASQAAGVGKLLFLGSSCIYPKQCPQPIREEYLLTDTLEYTNEPYAVAKIAGMKLCESMNLQYGTNYVSVMPTNLYGPQDNFDLETSHVLPALIRKLHLAKCLEQGDLESLRADLNARPIGGVDGSAAPAPILDVLSKHGISGGNETVQTTSEMHKYSSFISSSLTSDHRPPTTVRLWGSGSPLREFLHVDDLAQACLFVMDQVNFSHLVRLRTEGLEEGSQERDNLRNTHVNIGCGRDLSIRDLAILIQDIVGFTGQVLWDQSMPDGTPRKLLDTSRIESLGWTPSIDLAEGIRNVYSWYRQQQKQH